MTHYALSDGLVAVVALFGAFYILISLSRKINVAVPSHLVSAGLLIVGLAALIGTVRFITAQHGLLQAPHQWVSGLAGIVGSLWIALGLLQLRRLHRTPIEAQFIIPILIFVIAQFFGFLKITLLLASLLSLPAQIICTICLFRKKYTSASIWMFGSIACVVLAFSTSILLSDRADYAWHFYHTFLALWAGALVISLKTYWGENISDIAD